MENKTKQVRAAVGIIKALADAIKELKRVPSGSLYATVMNYLTIDQYNQRRAGMDRATRINIGRRNHMGKTLKEKQNRCPECDSTMTYLRLKTEEHVCRACGATWPMGKKKKK